MSKVKKIKDLDKHFGVLEGQETVQHRVYELETTETNVMKQEITKANISAEIVILQSKRSDIDNEISELQALEAIMTKE